MSTARWRPRSWHADVYDDGIGARTSSIEEALEELDAPPGVAHLDDKVPIGYGGDAVNESNVETQSDEVVADRT
jgi:hypothetical protein